MSDIGAQYLAEAINNNCQPHTLILRANNISDIGAQHLAVAINNNCQLPMLNLSFNNISHIGTQHLAVFQCCRFAVENLKLKHQP